MLSLESLACLDLFLWLGSGKRAAQVLHTSQSTVSRRSREALALLGLQPEQIGLRPGPLAQVGDPSPPLALGAFPMAELLTLERQVHQRHRLLTGAPLRLYTSYWARRAYLEPPPPGWWLAPLEPCRPPAEPLLLLEERIVDAAILSGPEVQRLDPLHWRVLDLARLPLRILAPLHHPLTQERGLRPSDLQVLPLTAYASIVPAPVRRCMERIDAGLGAPPASRQGPASLVAPTKSFATAFTRHLWPDLAPVDLALPIPASDHLVTRADLAWVAALDHLVQHLRQAIRRGRGGEPELELLLA